MDMLKMISRIILSVVLLTGFIGIAQAETKPTREEMAIKFRRSAYMVVVKYFGEMGAMVKGEMAYDKALFVRDADYVAFLSKLPKDGFIPGRQV
jgi:cytochrome c556